MAKTDTLKYEDRLRELIRAIRADNWTGVAAEFSGFAASTADEVADLVEAARNLILVMPDECGDCNARLRARVVAALAALDQEVQR